MDDNDYYDLAKELDECDQEVADFEANMLETIMKRGRGARISPKQRAILDQMRERYL